MRIDRYTQFLLTIIALCLLYLCARDLSSPSKAQAQSEGPMHVMLVDQNDRPVASQFKWPAGGLPIRVEVSSQ